MRSLTFILLIVLSLYSVMCREPVQEQFLKMLENKCKEGGERCSASEKCCENLVCSEFKVCRS